MPTIHDFRRENLRKLADTMGGPSALAKKLGYANSSFIVQMVGPHPIRQVSEFTARKFEQALDLVPNALDNPVDIALTLLANTGNNMVGSEDYIKRLVALAK